MTILGLDYGQKRVGVAISRNGLAFDLTILELKNNESLIDKIKKICKEEKVKKIIIGLSKNREREIGFQAKLQLDFGQKIESDIGLPVEFEDEIFTTREANRILTELGSKKNFEKVDAKAAQLILQSYLDRIEGQDEVFRLNHSAKH